MLGVFVSVKTLFHYLLRIEHAEQQSKEIITSSSKYHQKMSHHQEKEEGYCVKTIHRDILLEQDDQELISMSIIHFEIA